MNQSKVVELCQRMTKLMADPQHGLATWNIMCQECVEALQKELAPTGPTDLEIARLSVNALAMECLRAHAKTIGDGLERIRQTMIDKRSPALESLHIVLRLDAAIGTREK